MRWNLGDLREDVASLYGREQRDKLCPSLRSLEERSYFARFHYHAAMDGMREAIGDRDGLRVLQDLILSSDEAGAEFSSARLDAAANVVACLQSLHANADILAHVLYFALGMDLDEITWLPDRKVGLAQVADKLKKLADCADLLRQVKELMGHADFEYLGAIVNHSKHRAIVDVPYSFSFEEVGRTGLKLQAFSYDGKPYPSKWLDEVLPPEYDRQGLLKVQIGLELNSVVRRRLETANRTVEQEDAPPPYA